MKKKNDFAEGSKILNTFSKSKSKKFH